MLPLCASIDAVSESGEFVAGAGSKRGSDSSPRLFPVGERVPRRGRDLERFINMWRLAIVGCVTIIALAGRLSRPGGAACDILAESVLGAYLILALGLALYLAFFPWRRSLAKVVNLVDVAVPFVFLGGCIVLDRALVATNSQVFFFLYFFAVITAGLRSDPVIIRLVSIVVPASYGAVLALAVMWREVVYAAPDPVYGSFRLDLQLTRFMILVAVTWIIRFDVSLMVHDRAEALRDPLTGLYNRRFLREFLIRQMFRARREREPLSLLLVDLDGFKLYNDTHGHLAGDQAIVRVASALRTAVRANDVVARYGGDEFVVVLPNTTGEAARRIGREIAAAMPEAITLSAGVSCMGDDVDTPEGLLDAADRALFQAKRARLGEPAG